LREQESLADALPDLSDLLDNSIFRAVRGIALGLVTATPCTLEHADF